MSQAGIINIVGNSPTIPTQFITDSGTAVPSSNTIYVLGGAGTSTSASGDTIIVKVTNSGFTWNIVDSTDNVVQIQAENGYICNGTNLVVFLLPLSPTLGDSFVIISNTSRFQITENGGQQIAIGPITSTPGSGTVTSNTAGDQVELIYVGVNSGHPTFRGFAPQGTLSTL